MDCTNEKQIIVEQIKPDKQTRKYIKKNKKIVKTNTQTTITNLVTFTFN